MDLQPTEAGAGAGGGDEAASSPQAKLEGILEHVKRVMEIQIDTDLNMSDEDKGPFQNVFLQEIDRMNSLIKEIARSVRELELGLNGELTMSASMEALQNSLLFYRVPERWSNLAYPSMRALGSWLGNLEDRAKQLSDWTREPASIPVVTNIAYLFNPQSFLTAIMQTTSQKYKLELDKLFVLTDVTRKTVSEIDAPPREGAYITGLALDGARWDKENGMLAESNMKELFCEMPVINCKALLVSKKEEGEIYSCPVYKTQMRGPTFVTTAQLKTNKDPTKWVLAGVVMILDRA
jgi:dynein heavy chain